MAEEMLRYVALGDSSGVGVGAQSDGGYPERLFQRLKATGVHVGILNLAQNGATTRELIQGQVQKAISKQPALVTLGVGTNDVWRMVPITTFAMNLDLMGKQLAGCGARVIVSNLFDLTQAPIALLAETLLRIPRQAFTRRVEEMNDRLNAIARKHGLELFDLFSLTRKEIAAHPEYFSPDGFHPSAAGYDRWAELMWPQFESAAKACIARAPS
jgi:acyl-CoA thioesterase I